jgi:hypothetical protein
LDCNGEVFSGAIGASATGFTPLLSPDLEILDARFFGNVLSRNWRATSYRTKQGSCTVSELTNRCDFHVVTRVIILIAARKPSGSFMQARKSAFPGCRLVFRDGKMEVEADLKCEMFVRISPCKRLIPLWM